MAETVTCDCERLGFPQASFCDDDLFCPQCGGAVAWLTSDNEVADPDAPAGVRTLWVYPTPADPLDPSAWGFAVPLEFHSLDSTRARQARPLEIDPERSSVSAPNWFEPKPLPDPSDAGPHRVVCRLVPRPALVEQFGGDWFRSLPDDGVVGDLTVHGNCGEHKFRLRAFGEPRYRAVVGGDGVQPERRPPGEALGRWSLWRRGPQDLTIRVEPLNALVHIPEPQPGPGASAPAPAAVGEFAWLAQAADGDRAVNDGDSKLRVVRRIRAGAILGPGRPAEFQVAFDTTDWEQERPRVLLVTIPADVLLVQQFRLEFVRQAQGELWFDVGREFKLEGPLHYGERAATDGRPGAIALPPLIARNRGEGVLPILKPAVVERSGPPGVDWIEVSWREPEDDSELEVGQTVTIDLAIDLTNIDPDCHPPGRPLTALIRVRHLDYEASWSLRVVVEEVTVRRPLASPLAVDFGNSNTYAAVIAPGGEIRPVLGGTDPENVPTALYFTDLSDPSDPKFVIGREAVSLAEIDPGGLVGGLKRLLVAGPGRAGHVTLVRDRAGHSHEYTDHDLMLLFLARVVDDCQDALRQTVVHLGLSYPANFSPRARARLDRVIEGLRARQADLHPDLGRELRFEPLTTDEASAVALGFALDRSTFDQTIRPALAAGGDEFLVASFDFGGGSIDCALLRFRFTGTSRVIRYKSTHCGVGGDEAFGGDNVTAAVWELLRDRLARLLAEAAHPRRMTLPLAPLGESRARAASAVAWANTLFLWDLAEQVKRRACERPPTPAGRDRLRGQITGFFNRVVVADAGGIETVLAADPALVAAAGAAADAGGLSLDEDELYDHTVGRDLLGRSGYTIRQRVDRCMGQLRAFVDRAAGGGEPVAPLFVVLAGAGCRLPLVRERIAAHFPGVPVCEDRERAKSKVAFGLVRYLDEARHGEARVAALSVASEYTHAPIVWRPNQVNPPVVWVPSCTPLVGGGWHPLTDVPLAYCWTSPRDRRLFVDRDAAPEPERIGWFDLSAPPPAPGRGLPPEFDAHAAEVLLQVDGAEDRLRLRVVGGGVEYGDWELCIADE